MDIKFDFKKRNRFLHSRAHVLADDLSKIMKEPKKFAAYLGIAKKYDESELRTLAKYVLEKRDLEVKNRGKYFFGALRKLSKKDVGKKLTRKQKRIK